MLIYCCGCNKHVDARLISGVEIYPSRTDLADKPFWKCDICKNYVGCHHKTTDRTKPLGCIPTKEIRDARKEIHLMLDPLFNNNKKMRYYLYNKISKKIGREYHTAEIKSIEEANEIKHILASFTASLSRK